jgi:hypothetical protein
MALLQVQQQPFVADGGQAGSAVWCLLVVSICATVVCWQKGVVSESLVTLSGADSYMWPHAHTIQPLTVCNPTAGRLRRQILLE